MKRSFMECGGLPPLLTSRFIGSQDSNQNNQCCPGTAVPSRASQRDKSRCQKRWQATALHNLFALAILSLFAVHAPPLLRAADSSDPARPEPSLAPRVEISLADNWRTALLPAPPSGISQPAFRNPHFNDSAWRVVSIPHNWDDYYGFRQTKHGNLHGAAAYRTTFTLPASDSASATPLPAAKRAFLFFEGVGSYATVWVNGKLVGKHAGGLTTFTLDITDALNTDNTPNTLVVLADHHAGIRDLPWICGGCEPAYGFSEGSQPFGIHRPVRLVITDTLRIEPFGIHVWNDADLSAASKTATLHATVEVKNHGKTPRTFTITTRVVSPVANHRQTLSTIDIPNITIAPGEALTIPFEHTIANPQFWHPDTPRLHTFTAELHEAGASNNPKFSHSLDASAAAFGLRSIHWPAPADPDARFYINGEPFFINGVAEYEHHLGQSHAFTPRQIAARVSQIQSAGFNAFRDAHHPHNLRYAARFASDGMLWWTQFSAHNWFDNDTFRANFKTLLREWVRERRNNPALVLWGLQNESKLPEKFAAECAAIIRELDPTSSAQRKITTCNGGAGADWDVPQNWSGTYSGDIDAYADDLRRQHLVGEYGAWRSLGYHTEDAFIANKGPYTENRFAHLLETKVRNAETARADVAGHFMWPFITHANPGRNFGENGEQLADGHRPLDHIGPANNKGLLTLWGEPTEAYYMYRSNYAPAGTQPMVRIAMHTWPDRWPAPGKKSGIIVYSNCATVELFNGPRSLGLRQRGARGTHFQWDDVLIDTNTLRAEARDASGKPVATDTVHLHHMPPPQATAEIPNSKSQIPNKSQTSNSKFQAAKVGIRLNCGGPALTDSQGRAWLADRDYAEGDTYGSLSWAARFPNLAPATGSQRKTHDPIENIAPTDAPLYQTYRYGRDQLRYIFNNLPDGDYAVELHFIEPWYGIGSPTLDCAGWRLFDIAFNGETVQRDLDIWREAGGPNRALVKTYAAQITNNSLEIAFPRITSGQAVISAIAITKVRGASCSSSPATSAPASRNRLAENTPPRPLVELQNHLRPSGRDKIIPPPPPPKHRTHLDTGDQLISDDAHSTIVSLPSQLLEADWIQMPSFPWKYISTFKLTNDVDVYFASAEKREKLPAHWTDTGEKIQTASATYFLYRVAVPTNKAIQYYYGLEEAEQAPAAIIIKRRLPPPPPQIITNFASSDASARAIGNLKAGSQSSIAGADTPTLVAATLTDSDWIALPRSSKNETATISFTVTDHAEIYIPLPTDANAPAPARFADWVPVNNLKFATAAHPLGALRLIKKRYVANSAVTLGGETTPLPPGAIIIVRPVRESFFYQPDRSVAAPATTYRVIVGAGDRYGLNFRYQNPTAEPVTADLQIIEADGHLLRTDPLTFAPTAPGAWAALRTRTGASINAGAYQFRIIVPAGNAPALKLDSLEVE